MRHDPALVEQLQARRDCGRARLVLAADVAAIAAAVAAFALVPGRYLFALVTGA
jgi:hypothetical protein